MNLTRLFISILVFTTMVAVASASAGNCSNATIKGTYGYLVTGFDPYGPKAVLGQGTADGNGNLTGWVTINENGTVYRQVPFTATYTVAKNCTGSMAITLPGMPTRTENFFLNDNKKGSYTIRTDGGVESGIILAQGSTACSPRGRKQSFAARVTGTAIGSGPVAYVGQSILDRKGNISGSVTMSFYNSWIDTEPTTGTYTENADCTGTAQITPAGGYLAASFDLVFVNEGKTVLMIETDANWTLSGTLQQ